MPILNDTSMEKVQVGRFGYSATRIDELGASEYTLVTIVLDTSPSVSPFKRDLEKMLQETLRSCQYSPRADNLMIRLLYFNHTRQEIHGFKLLQNCNLDDYRNTIDCDGYTALYDAVLDAVEGIMNYGTILTRPGNDFAVNAIVFVITDGMDNQSTYTPKQIRKVMKSLVRGEAVESIQGVLIGINPRECGSYLQAFKDKAGFSQYVETKDATAKSLAKLAEFVSQSISAQSLALGTGDPLASLTF